MIEDVAGNDSLRCLAEPIDAQKPIIFLRLVLQKVCLRPTNLLLRCLSHDTGENDEREIERMEKNFESTVNATWAHGQVMSAQFCACVQLRFYMFHHQSTTERGRVVL